MEKLINLNVYDAKNMICVWNENEPKNGYRSGIALEDAVCGFMVPRHYVVGVFDSGDTKAAGIFGLNDLNEYELFMYNEFCYHVDYNLAKAFVRHEIMNSDKNGAINECIAKCRVYERLLSSGVAISKEAEKYFLGL
jgi:hypothetical protein